MGEGRGPGFGMARLDAILRPKLIMVKMKRYLRFVDAVGKITVGNSAPLPSLRSTIDAKSILVLAPHPDDEVLGCGGTVKKCTVAGARVTTVYFTDGSEGNDSVGAQELVNMRKGEAEAGLKVLGCGDCRFLDFPDGSLRATDVSIKAVRDVLDSHRPDAVFVPFFMDNHPDHIQTAVILADALKGYDGEVTCYCYEVWTPLYPNLLVDITETIDVKMAAMDAHASQTVHQNIKESVDGLNTYRAIGLGKKVKACEAFYRCSKKEYIRTVLGR
jgi:LmbE family N-acetylglucosaminyl deacetylase